MADISPAEASKLSQHSTPELLQCHLFDLLLGHDASFDRFERSLSAMKSFWKLPTITKIFFFFIQMSMCKTTGPQVLHYKNRMPAPNCTPSHILKKRKGYQHLRQLFLYLRLLKASVHVT